MKLLQAVISSTALFAGAVHADPLPALSADVGTISVSGLSSGAAMASQLGVAYSNNVRAIGMMAGTPYLCAQGASIKAVGMCLLSDKVDSDNLIASARYLQVSPSTLTVGEYAIDRLDNIKGQKVWVSRGTLDKVVGPNATGAVRKFYKVFEAEFAEASPSVPHTLPTDKPNLGPCDNNQLDPDFVSSCGVDSVGAMFHHLFGWKPDGKGIPKPENLKWFDQEHYTQSGRGRALAPRQLSMADKGRIYVPTACAAGKCPVHVALHGCAQGSDEAFDVFTREAGYNEWAEKQGMIVLYPRVVATQEPTSYIRILLRALPYNPYACWDWWGYSPEDRGEWRGYAIKGAPQMRSIMNMVNTLAQKTVQAEVK